MKSILISIKPIHVANILDGRKTLEIRKSFPKYLENEPIECYIYCSKGTKYKLYKNSHNKYWVNKNSENYLNGKVVAKFTLKKVEKIYFGEDYWKATDEPINILEKACLSARDITRYLNGEGYAWHISDLVIFDEPKELSDFKHCTEKTCIYGKCHKYMHCLKTLTKAPQSWCYVEAML